MPVSRETQNILNQRSGTLAALTQHPSWPELEAEVEREIERSLKKLSKRILRTESMTAEEQAELRGFVRGARWLLAVPTAAEHSLEKFLREQGLEVPDE